MKIRNLGSKDLPELRRISRAAVMHSVNAPNDEKQEILEGIFNNLKLVSSSTIPGAFLISEVDEALAGFILIKNYWNLSDLFVSPNYQGKGMGYALWAEALDACERYSERNSIRVNSSLNAVKFYESLGFKRIDVKADLPHWIVPLERTLAGPR